MLFINDFRCPLGTKVFWLRRISRGDLSEEAVDVPAMVVKLWRRADSSPVWTLLALAAWISLELLRVVIVSFVT